MSDEYVPDDEALHTPEARQVMKTIRAITGEPGKPLMAHAHDGEEFELGTCRKHQTFFRAGTMCVFCERDEEGM